jgi:glycerol-3-phosphate acyltransferase PlsY
MDPEISREWLTMCCAAAAVFGHVWPVFHRFKGGKGAATYVGTLAIVGPALIVPLVIVWALTIVLSGYVGLASMIAAVSVPAWLAVTKLPAEQTLFIYCAVMALFIISWHRSNIQRMRDGSEHRNTRLMLFSSKRKSAGDEHS